MIMELLWTILQFALVFGVLLLAHETGHFIMCRIAGVPVEEYGIGLPPRILTLFHWQGTAFTLNALPFGAFVRPRGEVDRQVEGGLANARPIKKLGVYFGGPIMNLLVGLILLIILYYRLGAPDTSKVLVSEVAPQSPAMLSGLQPGDQIIAINDVNVNDITVLQNAVSAHLGEEIQITVLRDSRQYVFSATPRVNPPENQGALGVILTYPFTKVTIFQAISTGVSSTYEQIKGFVLLPGRLLAGTISKDESRVVGIKGIYDMYAAAGEADATASTGASQMAPIFRLSFIASISIALGLTNLLPIPALDGGRIVLVLPELFLRRKIPQKVENYLISISFVALLLIMVIITYYDFTNPVITR
jgi:regulator of sigma E protease